MTTNRAENGSDCPTGKQQWATRAFARESAAALGGLRGATARAYRCPLCGTFHVGNRSRAGKRRSVLGR